MLSAAEAAILDRLTNSSKHAHYLLKDFEPSKISALKDHVAKNLEICDKEIEETVAKLQRLEEAKKKGLEQLAVLDRATTSWMDLPPEILIRIFRQLAGKTHIPLRAGDPVRALSYVCSRWREIILGTPTLWDSIHISLTGTDELTEAVESILGRSGNRKLDLTFTCDIQRQPPGEAVNCFSQILSMAMTRTSALSLEFSPTALADFTRAVAQSESAPFPNVTSLNIAAAEYSMLQPSELVHQLTHVSELTLSADRHCLGASMSDILEYPWHRYTTITLNRHLIPLPDAYEFMSNCHRLVSLDLSIGFDMTPFDTTMRPQINLPMLEQMTIAVDVETVADNAVVLFFTFLNIPRVQKLRLSPFLPDPGQYLELPRELWPHLYKMKRIRSLEMEECTAVDTEGILRQFPSLEYLSICDEVGNEMRHSAIDALASGVAANLRTLRCGMVEEDIVAFFELLATQWKRAAQEVSQATASCIHDARISVKLDNSRLSIFNLCVQKIREEFGVPYMAEFVPPATSNGPENRSAELVLIVSQRIMHQPQPQSSSYNVKLPGTNLDTHSSGCFSFSWRKRKKASRVTTAGTTETQPPPYQPRDEPVRDPEPKDVPSTGEYALEATKKTLEILQGAAGLIPIPLVKEVLEIGVTILSTCEAINEVQEKVNVLKNRIGEFLLVIAKVVKDKDDNPVTKLSEDLSEEMDALKRCLTAITARLDQIKDQNRVLTALLPQANKETIEECLVDFQDSIDRFQTLRGIHASQDLGELQVQVAEMYGLTQEVLQKVDHIEGRVEEVKSAVDELKAMMDRNTSLSTYTAAGLMPRVPNIFFGRTAVVDSIAKELSAGPSTPARVCILGPGGQGKTSTALAIMNHSAIQERYSKQHRYWVPCISANSPSTFLTILAKHLQAPSKSEDPLQAIFSILSESEEPRLILLDNFETPWHPVEGTQQAIKDILSSLDSLAHVNILVTMRSEFPPLDHWTAEKLSSLNPEDARKIYTAIDKEVTPSSELDGLLAALGYLPYAITLMATRGKRSLSSPAELLEEWKKSGTDMLSKAEEGMDHSIELSVNSKFVSGSPGALRLLQVLSMLPAGVLRNDLKIWMESWDSDALETLREAALVRTSEVGVEGTRKIHLFVLPVVQSYMRRRGRIPDAVQENIHRACCKFLVTRSSPMTGPSIPTYRQEIAAIASQETNIQSLLTTIVADAKAKAPTVDPTSTPPINLTVLPDNADEETTALQAALIFSAYQFWTRPRTELAEEVVSLAISMNDSWREAEGRFCLGHVLWRLSSFREASKQLGRARDIYLALSNHPRAIRSAFMSIISLISLPDTAPEAFMALVNDAFAEWEPRAEENKEVKAWYLHYKSQFALLAYRDAEKAIEHAKESQQLFEEVNLPYEAGLSLYLTGRAYSMKGEFKKALEALENTIQDFTDDAYGSLGIKQDLGPAYFTKARALKALDRWDEELMDTLKTCLKFDQGGGLPVEIAISMIELAEVYVRNEDWPAARLLYEEAIKKCAKFDELTAQWAKKHSEHNLRYVVNREKNISDESITFIAPDRN